MIVYHDSPLPPATGHPLVADGHADSKLTDEIRCWLLHLHHLKLHLRIFFPRAHFLIELRPLARVQNIGGARTERRVPFDDAVGAP